MADNALHQMYCCLACCGPFRPDVEALRSNSLSARALYYIEGQAVKNQYEFNCTGPVQLLGEKEDSHVFMRLGFNANPVLEEFYYKSLSNRWRDNDTNFAARNFAPNANLAFNQIPNLADRHTVLNFNKTTKCLALWDHPEEIPQMEIMHDLVKSCVEHKNGEVLFVPNIEHQLPICKPCNDIMTQLQGFSNLMVRSNVAPDHLVPMRAIKYHRVRDAGPNFTVTSAVMETPTFENSTGRDFFFQACLAYSIHRTLPTTAYVDRMNLASRFERNKAHQFFASLGFLSMEILSLLVEYTYGKNGGVERLSKPKYRYRGMIELYVAYMIWLFLKNDTPAGEPDGSARVCNLDFCSFHRYFFSSFLDAIIAGFPDYAHVTTIQDVVFSPNWMVAGAVAFRPGMEMGTAEDTLGYIAGSISIFYTNMVRPYFSRHVAGLLPNPRLAVRGREADYLKQITVYNMIIAREDLETLLHLCERATVGDTETFINMVGVHAVLAPWNSMLQSAPPRGSKLLESYMDSETLKEYRNIMEKLKVREKAAEAIYLECNALSQPEDPADQDELNALRQAPKCSPVKAVLRLRQCGAFGEGGEDV